ncbi:hypothetical protein DFS34DRAFT_496028 [Phlyctochytrium arcticum]|nr:hypothetical protein DFS34DRAFT_496028 [Phlyctochytrium arcticum]
MRAGVFLLIEAVILAVWTGVNPPLPSRVYLSTYNFATCQSSNSDFHWLMTGLLLAINGLLILAAVGMAYFTRHIRAEYNEAHKIALIVWNTASLSFIGLAILFIDALSAQVVFAIRSLIILECNIFFIVVFFFPIAKKILSKIPSRRNDGTGSKVMTMAGGSSSGSDDTKATKARMPDVGDATKHFPAPQVNSVFSTGILVGRYAKSHFALGFAAWHQYKIIYHPRDLILSLIPYDAKDGSGHTYRIKSQDVTPPAMDANNLVSFGICINETHYFTFQTPSMEAARAWVEQLGDTRKPKNPVHSTMDRSAARFNA